MLQYVFGYHIPVFSFHLFTVTSSFFMNATDKNCFWQVIFSEVDLLLLFELFPFPQFQCVFGFFLAAFAFHFNFRFSLCIFLLLCPYFVLFCTLSFSFFCLFLVMSLYVFYFLFLYFFLFSIFFFFFRFTKAKI